MTADTSRDAVDRLASTISQDAIAGPDNIFYRRIKNAADTLLALLARAEAADAELAAERSGRCWYWLADDPEYDGADPADVIDGADIPLGEPVLISKSRYLAQMWAVSLVVTRDADGDPDETEVRTFATEAEAIAAVAAYLRATGREQEAQTVEDKSDE